MSADQSEWTLTMNQVPVPEGWGGSPKIPSLRWKRGDLERLGELYTSSYSWPMVDQGLETTSVRLNIILSLHHLHGSYLQRVSVFLHLSEPWSVFHHIHNWLTGPVVEEAGLVSRSMCLLAPLRADPDLGARAFLASALAHIWQYRRVSGSGSLHGAQAKTYLGLWGPLCPWTWPLVVPIRCVLLLLMVQLTRLFNPILGLGLHPDYPSWSTEHQRQSSLSTALLG